MENSNLLKAELNIFTHTIYHHNASVTSVAISKDLRFIASASKDRSIKIYDISAQAPYQTFFSAHSDIINQIRFCFNNKWIISCSKDLSIHIFDIESRSRVAALTNVHEDNINAIAVSPKGNYFASASDDYSVKLFNLNDQKEIAHFENLHKKRVIDVCFHPKGKYLITASEDKLIKVLDIEKKRVVTVLFDLHDERIRKMDCTPDGKYIITAADDHSLKVVDFEKKELVHAFENTHNSPISSFALSSTGEFVVTISDDKNMKVFNIESKMFIMGWENVHPEPASCIEVSIDGRFIVTGSSDASVKKFSVGKPSFFHAFPNAHQATINSVDVSRCGRYAATASSDRTVAIYDLTTLEKIQIINTAHSSKGAVNSVIFSPDKKYIISGSNDKSIKIFRFEGFQHLHTIENAHDDQILSLCITPDSRFIISCSADCSIRVFDFFSRKLVHTFKDVHTRIENSINSMVLSNDGQWIITGSSDKSIRIHDLPTFKPYYTFTDAHRHYIHSVAISNNQKLIASGSSDKSVSLFDTECLEKIHHFENAHKGVVMTVVFTTDDRFLLSGAGDNAINIYDVLRKERIHRIHKAHQDGITGLVFSPTSRRFISVSEDCSMKIHNFYFNDPGTLSVVELGSKMSLSIFCYGKLSKFLESRHDNRRVALLKECASIVVYPQGYNMLHLCCLDKPTLNLLKACFKLRIPFVQGFDDLTPLHFLVKSNELMLIDYFLKKAPKLFNEISDETFKCLSNILVPLINTNSFFLQNFLKFASDTPQTYAESPLPRFAHLKGGKQDFQIFQSRVFDRSRRDLLMSRGDKPISLLALRLEINYDFSSQESYDLILSLYKCKNEYIHKMRVVQSILEYYWVQCRTFLWLVSIIYYIFVALFSVYVVNWFGNRGVEIVLFVYNVIIFAYEAIEAISAPGLYFSEMWNYTDITRITLFFIFLMMSKNNDEHLDALKGLVAFALLLTYFKGLAYLRVVFETRTTVRVVISTCRDTLGFVYFSAVLMICWVLIFNVYAPQDFWLQFLRVYVSNYGVYDIEGYGIVQNVHFIISTFILSVILQQLLVAVLGDTLVNSLEKTNVSDSQEKLAMVIEAMHIKRALIKIFCCKRRCEKKAAAASRETRGYLFRAWYLSHSDDTQDEEEVVTRWNGKFYELQKGTKVLREGLTSHIDAIETGVKKEFFRKLKKKTIKFNQYFKNQVLVDLREDLKEEFQLRIEGIRSAIRNVIQDKKDVSAELGDTELRKERSFRDKSHVMEEAEEGPGLTVIKRIGSRIFNPEEVDVHEEDDGDKNESKTDYDNEELNENKEIVSHEVFS